MITKDSSAIGRATQFGADWSGKRCGTKTRAGGICPKPANRVSGRWLSVLQQRAAELWNIRPTPWSCQRQTPAQVILI